MMTHVWLNGQLIPDKAASLPISDRGFTLGDGLFETMLWTGTRIRFFDDHMARLTDACEHLGFDLPNPVATIESSLIDLCLMAGSQRGSVRLTLTRGTGPRGLTIPNGADHNLVASFAALTDATRPVSIATAAIARNCTAPSARFKTLSYIDNVIALAQAKLYGGDDAVMLGTNGNIACASAANIIMQFQGTTLTPAVPDGALPGIVRGRLIGARLVEEANISPAMLATCTSCALSNALIGVRPVGAIDGRALAIDKIWLARLNQELDAASIG